MNNTYSLPELFAQTADPEINLAIEDGFEFSAHAGDQFTHCLTFGYEKPWRIVMVARSGRHVVSTVFCRLPSGLYRLDRSHMGTSPHKAFKAHMRHVAQLAREHAEKSMFQLDHVAHMYVEQGARA